MRERRRGARPSVCVSPRRPRPGHKRRVEMRHQLIRLHTATRLVSCALGKTDGKEARQAFNCPTEFTLAVLGGEWKTVILCYLKERPCRYAELRKLLPSLSDKMLTERLADLLESGLIARKKLAGRRGADGYVLTARGRTLSHLLESIYTWGLEHAAAFKVQVEQPLKSSGLRP